MLPSLNKFVIIIIIIIILKHTYLQWYKPNRKQGKEQQRASSWVLSSRWKQCLLLDLSAKRNKCSLGSSVINLIKLYSHIIWIIHRVTCLWGNAFLSMKAPWVLRLFSNHCFLWYFPMGWWPEGYFYGWNLAIWRLPANFLPLSIKERILRLTILRQSLRLAAKMFLALLLQTVYTLTLVCIFSILFSIHFIRSWQGEFV